MSFFEAVVDTNCAYEGVGTSQVNQILSHRLALQLDPEGRWRMESGEKWKEGVREAGRRKEEMVGPSGEAED